MVKIICKDCGKEVEATTERTQRCPDCRAKRRLQQRRECYQRNKEHECALRRERHRAQMTERDADKQRRLAEQQLMQETLAQKEQEEKQEAEKLEAEVKEKKVRKKLHVVPALSIDEVLRRAKGTGLSYGQYVSQMEREATA